jgi:hypothetical protein
MRRARKTNIARAAGLAFLAFVSIHAEASFAGSVSISVDATANVHPINPNIYGVAFASTSDLTALNALLNRSGGNATSTYNWLANAQNLASDWYFESYPGSSSRKGGDVDNFIASTRQAGAQAIVTVPLTGWVAKLGPSRSILPSFSVAKYGAQCSTDYWFPDAGNGLKPDCATLITNNTPGDAYVADTPTTEQAWFNHLIGKWGPSSGGGVSYYAMDNEASIWFSTHRDILPVGVHDRDYRDRVIAMSAALKAVDPNVKVMAPEEWGWEAYFYSGYDQQYAAAHGYSAWPDHDKTGQDYVPWLLKQWKKAGHPVDILSLHFYPQAGEFGDDVSTNMQLLRNRSTRQLWDPNYISESWIGDKVNLIPRMKQWIASSYYPGTPVAITEYNWGAENHINGATTQADIYGIFGREGLDMATRWATPDHASPTFKAMQMYRNYDGAGSTFGDTSIAARVPNPDNLSAFAALRSSDHAMTIMVINKALTGSSTVTINLAHFTVAGTAKTYRLTASNKIKLLTDRTWAGGVLSDTAPAQSITLYILPK